MGKSEDLVSAYLKTREPEREAYLWAFSEMLRLCEEDPGEAVRVTLDLIEACVTEAQLRYVAAGPVEDLLGVSLFPRFAEACKSSAKVRRAMQLVFVEEADAVFPLWKALLLEYGLWNP